MELEIKHVEIQTTNLKKAKDFYVNMLGLEVIEENPKINLLAVKAGPVRISIFAGFEKLDRSENQTGIQLIFKTADIEQLIKKLTSKGMIFNTKISEAPGFCKYIVTKDPDGNIVEFAEYLRDPLKPV